MNIQTLDLNSVRPGVPMGGQPGADAGFRAPRSLPPHSVPTTDRLSAPGERDPGP